MNDQVDAHIESYLGKISYGWRPVGEPVGVQVCLFRDQPFPGIVTYSTLGLSRHILAMPVDAQVRQEVVIAVHDRFEDESLVKLIHYLADFIVREHRALLRGEVISLGYPICSGSQCTNLYVSLPVVFPDGFDVFDGSQPSTVFAWLVPITEAEAEVIQAKGWSHFERELETSDPDLLDLTRSSLRFR